MPSPLTIRQRHKRRMPAQIDILRAHKRGWTWLPERALFDSGITTGPCPRCGTSIQRYGRNAEGLCAACKRNSPVGT